MLCPRGPPNHKNYRVQSMLYCLINSANLADSETKFRGLADETWDRTLVAGLVNLERIDIHRGIRN